MPPISRRSLLNYIGIAILVAGMATADFIYWRSLQHAAATDDTESPYDSKVYEQTIEKTVGIFGVIMDQWSRSMAQLGQPRSLAIAIAGFSILASGGCFFAASRMPAD